MKIKWWHVIGALLVLYFICSYPIISAIVLVLAVLAVVTIFVLKRKILLARNEKANAARKAELERIENEIQVRTRIFNAEIDAIPRVQISVSSPARRQYLKDMPEYSFNNVTSKTKLSAIFPIVFIDVETTGLSPSNGEIIEVAAIKFDVGMKPVARFSTLCRPKHLIPAEASAVNNITDDMVEDAPNFKEIAPALSEFIKDCNLAGHNLEFDMRFLYAHGTELPFHKKFFDTLEIAQRTIKRSDITNHKLETLCSWYGIHRGSAHRALSDCYATAKIFTHLVFNRTSRDLEKETGA